MQDPKAFEKERHEVGIEKLVEDTVPQLLNLMGWKGGENVLDFGCGAGGTGNKFLLPKVIETEGILYSVDISEKMVAYAREFRNHERIRYAVANILEENPFGVEFDKVFSVNVFDYCKDLRKVLSGIRGVMKPGGQLGFTTFPMTTWFEVFNKLSKTQKWAKYLEDYQNYLPNWSNYKGTFGDHLKKMLEEVGFKVVHIQDIGYKHKFEIEKLLDFLHTLNPCAEKIPKDLTPELREEYRKIFTELHGLPVDAKEVQVDYDYAWGLVEKM